MIRQLCTPGQYLVWVSNIYHQHQLTDRTCFYRFTTKSPHCHEGCSFISACSVNHLKLNWNLRKIWLPPQTGHMPRVICLLQISWKEATWKVLTTAAQPGDVFLLSARDGSIRLREVRLIFPKVSLVKIWRLLNLSTFPAQASQK